MVRDHYDQHFLLTFPHGYDLPALLQRFAELSFLDEFIDCASEEVKRKHDKPLKYRVNIVGKEFLLTYVEYAPPGIILQYCKDDIRELRRALFEVLKTVENLRERLHRLHEYFVGEGIKPEDCSVCGKDATEVLKKGWNMFTIKE